MEGGADVTIITIQSTGRKSIQSIDRLIGRDNGRHNRCGLQQSATGANRRGGATPFYRIGPGDALNVFVWQNTQLSTPAIVGPDGRISLPLIKDMEAAGKTPTQLARDIENRLTKYVTDPVVTVMVSSYVGPFSQQVRVIGEVGKPQALVYRKGMTVLDAMLAVGGLTPYAAGSRATLVRTWRDTQTSYGLRLDKLMQDGDLSANAPLEPGDVITVPQTYF